MIILIIAGGSGTRLWPLSTPDFPKHLLSVNGDNLSLLQNTYKRAKLLSDKIYIVTEASHVHHVKDQLKDIPEERVICEPGRRGTANCIVAALEVISRYENPKEPIASIHSDHYIRDLEGFKNTFIQTAKISTEKNSLVLLGVEPDYPSTAFGYIEKGHLLNDSFAYEVNSFKEKPDFDTARSYMRSGNYLWNCGYFVGSLNTFIINFKQFAPNLEENYEKLKNTTKESYEDVYLSFESEPIDTALIEKISGSLVVPASFDWMDLGSFRDLAESSGGDEQGNSIIGNVKIEEVENSLIQNEEDKPVAVIGLDNVIVVNTKDGVLVVRKDLSQMVGEIAKQINKEKS